VGISFLTPLFLAGFLAISVPIVVHLIRRHQGRKLDFPSLMFLRRLPVQSVQRLRIRDWPLLLLRAGALALIVLAFARPVLQLGTTEEGVDGDGLREVVITLDRSWSMARGDRWERAVEAAREVLDGLVTPDRVSLVLFDGVGRVAVEPTLDAGQVRAVLDTVTVGWGSTQIGAGLQAAGGVVQNSERSRREVFLISDFQRRGWEDGPRDRLPAGTRLLPVDVGDDGLGTLIVADVTLEHSVFEGRQRVQPQARIVRQGDAAPTRARVALEMDGREVASRIVDFDAEGAHPVAFDPFTVPEAGVRGAILLEPEDAPPEEPFRFHFSPREILSILLVESGGSGTSSGPYLRSALGITGGTPVRLQTRTGAGVSTADLAGVDLVIFNDVPLPSGASGNVLRDHVLRGGGILVVAGPMSAPASWEAEWDPFLPARPGAAIERNPTRGGSLARIDRDHPIFSTFSGVEGAGLGNPRFFRYRALPVPTPETTVPGAGIGNDDGLGDGRAVIARFDDGAPALAARSVGDGRVLVWTSTLDTTWSDFPLHPVYVPVVREMTRFASTRRESFPFFEVGQPLDARYLLGEPGAGPAMAGTEAAIPQSDPEAETPAVGPAQGILVGPAGTGIELHAGVGSLVQLSTPGFYEVRMGDESGPVSLTLAVNPDAREADPARVDPNEVVIAVAPSAGAGVAGGVAEASQADGALTAGADRSTVLQEGERRQSAWRFLLLGAILLLILESLLAGRREPLANQGARA
jgi:hypothetical protein